MKETVIDLLYKEMGEVYPGSSLEAALYQADESYRELLEALKAIVALDDGTPDLWHFEKEFDAARAAIAKAEGV